MLRVARLAMAVAVVFAASAASAQTADELIEKHLGAMGGRDALKKVTSQAAFGTISVSVQGADIGGPIEIYHKTPNKSRTYFRLDLSAMGAGEMAVDQRCDGKTAVAMNSMQGDREITGGQLQNLLNQRFPTPLLDYKEAGAKVELAGKEKLNGRDVFVLVYTPKAGPAARQYFDAETFLISRVVAKVDAPELGGEVEQTVDTSDYRAVDGIKVPFSIHIQNSAQTVGIALTKVEMNKAVDEAMFSKPAVK
jgi:hypothetical protein